jgi:hypothetical protein
MNANPEGVSEITDRLLASAPTIGTGSAPRFNPSTGCELRVGHADALFQSDPRLPAQREEA